MNELVSIVIPTYNREAHIRGAVESCLKQTYTNIEIIISDDRSTDNTLSIVSEMAENNDIIRIVKAKYSGKGAPYARMNGVKAAKGEYIVFLDSDDKLTKDSIEARLKCFLYDKRIDLVYGDYIQYIADKDEPVIGRADNMNDYSWEETRQYILQELSLCRFSVMMVRRRIFEQGVAMDLRFPTWQDDDFVISVVLNGGMVRHSESIVAEVVGAEGNISSNRYKRYLGIKMIVKKYGSEIISVDGFERRALWEMRKWRTYLLYRIEVMNNQKKMIRKHLLIRAYRILNHYLKKRFNHVYT